MSIGTQQSLIGRQLGGRYVVQRVLGTGAMGTVYCARQIDLGTLVAIKVLHPRLATDTGLVQRFEREAFATSRLDHPNALRVLDYGEDGGLLYLVTEYVEATDLLTVMEAEWPLSDERIVTILSQVLSALVVVHEIGIVHRDLKPENILILSEKSDDGTKIDVVKVCDFGIAKVARPTLAKGRPFSRRLTAEGVVIGTPDYMSPEQARGQAVDGRSDLYSVGVVLYHLLAGQTPFNADTPVGLAVQHVSEAPVPPSRHRAVHPELEAVCLRAMSKQPEDRFQTAQDMRTALREALNSRSKTALVKAQSSPGYVGSSFSTSSAAIVYFRQEAERSHLGNNQRRRKRLAFGYAALASVMMITASAFVASRSHGTGEASHRVEASTALVSPPTSGTALAPSSNDESIAEEPAPVTERGAPATIEPSTALPPAMEPRTSEPVHVAPRGRPPSAVKAEPRVASAAAPSPAAVAVASPVANLPIANAPVAAASPVANAPAANALSTSAPPDSTALLVRNDPWSHRTDAPEPSTRSVAPATSPEPRTSAEAHRRSARETGPIGQNAPAAPPPASTPPSSVDMNHASFGVINVVTSAGISATKVKVGLAHVPFLGCYQRALRARPSDAPFDTDLHLTFDLGGRVVSSVLSKDGNLTGLRGCIETAVRGAKVQGVDTGDGSATVQLRFSPR